MRVNSTHAHDTPRPHYLRSAFPFILSLTAFFGTPAPLPAETAQIRGLLHCGASSAAPDKYPPFDSEFTVTAETGKLTAERHHGQLVDEVYQGTVAPSGMIHISSHGVSRGRRIRSEFSGRFNESAETVLSGGFNVVDGRGHRDCSISFLEEPEQLRIKFGIVKASTQAGTQPIVPPKESAATPMAPVVDNNKTAVDAEQDKSPAPTLKGTKEEATTPAMTATNDSNNNQQSPAKEQPETQVHRLTEDLAGQIALLQTLVKELQEDRQQNANPPALTDETIALVEGKLQGLKQRTISEPTNASEYQTPVRPNDG